MALVYQSGEPSLVSCRLKTLDFDERSIEQTPKSQWRRERNDSFRPNSGRKPVSFVKRSPAIVHGYLM